MTTIDPNSHVLVVDDSNIARRLLIAQLNELGITSIVEAESGQDALSKLQASKTKFDLIITDLRMPEMSGASLLQALNEENDYKSIPKLIASVETDRGTVLDAVLIGADGYILKPTTTDVLRVKLERAFARRRAA